MPQPQPLSLASFPYHRSRVSQRSDPSLLPKERSSSNASDEIVINSPPIFTGFSKLPLELRIKIWRLALPYRLVTITPKLDPESFTGEVELATDQIVLRGVCRESRREALKGYTQITFNDEARTSTYINWSRDTIFLDLPDECLHVDRMFEALGIAFRSVQVLAIRMRAHCFWGLPEFLRQSTQLQKLLFIDDPERPNSPDNENSSLYLMDLGAWGFIRGSIQNFSEGHHYSQEGTWIGLIGSNEDEIYGTRQWEMSFEKISLVRSLIRSGDRYFLLLPLT